ncbi:MAG: DUF6314 family protein [Paracoccaceae bacterium]|nr:DUF6314 family protein [Paracoccaceae bacterium]
MSEGLPSLTALAGAWTIARVIRHADGNENRFDGTARFTWSGPRLIEDEEGFLTVSDGRPPVRATRRYIWAQEGARLEVMFHDMRPFHTVPLGTARPETTFLCPPDRYEVSYDFSRFPDWSSEWRVTGPRKDYRMVTSFARST